MQAAEGREGKELARWVSIIQSHGCPRLRAMLQSLPDERDASVTFGTAHKSKGREWSTVRLADDYLIGGGTDGEPGVQDAELRLLYVAATRARQTLDVPATLTDRLGKIGTMRAERQRAA